MQRGFSRFTALPFFIERSQSLSKLFHVSLSYETFAESRRKMVEWFSTTILSRFSNFAMASPPPSRLPFRSPSSTSPSLFLCFHSSSEARRFVFHREKSRYGGSWGRVVAFSERDTRYQAITILFESRKSGSVRKLITKDVGGGEYRLPLQLHSYKLADYQVSLYIRSETNSVLNGAQNTV